MLNALPQFQNLPKEIMLKIRPLISAPFICNAPSTFIIHDLSSQHTPWMRILLLASALPSFRFSHRAWRHMLRIFVGLLTSIDTSPSQHSIIEVIHASIRCGYYPYLLRLLARKKISTDKGPLKASYVVPSLRPHRQWTILPKENLKRPSPPRVHRHPIQSSDQITPDDSLPLFSPSFDPTSHLGDPAPTARVPSLLTHLAQFDQMISRSLEHAVMYEPFWEKLRTLARFFFPNLPPLGPHFRKVFVCLHAYYLLDSSPSSAFYLNLIMTKPHCSLDEVIIIDVIHSFYLVVSRLFSYYRRRKELLKMHPVQSVDDQLDKERRNLTTVLNDFLKWLTGNSSPAAVNEAISRMRLFSTIKSFALDVYNLMLWFIDFLREKISGEVAGMDNAVRDFFDEVDKLNDVVIDENGDTTTLRNRLTKSQESRLKVLALYQTGIRLRRNFEKHKIPQNKLQALEKRLAHLKKLISGSQAAFVGAEGKVKPFTVYFWGQPKMGKTILIPHLAADLCYLLDEPDFDKSRDIYTMMSNTPYHDQYSYQRFAVINDIFQMKQEDYRVNEIYNVIQMSDESPCPLNIAECTGKGAVYFCSPFLFLTSNFSLDSQLEELSARMHQPQAFKRRMDMIVEVSRDLSINLEPEEGFRRDVMRFNVTLPDGKRHEGLTWSDFLALSYHQIVRTFNLSRRVNDTTLSDKHVSELSELKDLLRNPFRPARKNDIEEDVFYPASEQQPLDLKSSTHVCVMCQAQFNDEKELKDHHPRCPGLPEHSKDNLPKDVELLQCGKNIYGFRCQKCTHVDGSLQNIRAHVDSEICKVFCQGLDSVTTLPSKVWDTALFTKRCIVMPMQEPSFTLRLLGGKIWPYKVLSDEAALYCEIAERYATLRTLLKFVSAFASGLAVYSIFHSCVSKAASLVPTQAFWGTPSSGEAMEYPRRAPKRREKLRRQVLTQAGITNETFKHAMGPNLAAKVITNTVTVCSNGRNIQGFFLCNHILILPYHVFNDVENDSFTLHLSSGLDFSFSMSDFRQEEVYLAEEAHVIALDLHDYMKIPPFADLRRYFIPNLDTLSMSCPSGYMFSRRINSVGQNAIFILTLQEIMPENRISLIDERFHRNYDVSRPLVARVPSLPGDCGALWIMDRNSETRLCGFHIAGSCNEDGTGRAAVMTQGMAQRLSDYFGINQPRNTARIEEAPQLVPTEALDNLHTCYLEGRTDFTLPRASRTDIVKSPWFGIRPNQTCPGRLKDFVDGNGFSVSPARVNFQKMLGQRSIIDPGDFEKPLLMLSDWYPRPEQAKRKVLTLEEAVYGSGDGYNPSIKADAGVGYPWLLHYKRTDLLSLGNSQGEGRWISDTLREAVGKLLTLADTNILIVDCLKDERTSLKKYEEGNTRIFSILPIHYNIALKMLYGSFVHYVQSRCHLAPVKMGISPLPEDWGRLYDFLVENHGEIIAGDYSGWDKRAHYEVFRQLVDWVNDWYDDEWRHVREDITLRVFSCEHYLEGDVYTTTAGMPSGCYLTTCFNSLANLLYWYLFLQKNVIPEELADHQWWFRPAIYGDDHVISVYGHPHINMQSFSDWVTPLGLAYTDTSKKRPLTPYVPWEEVTFLKRHFVVREGYVWGPLPLELIYEMIQWYRNTAYSKSLPKKERWGQILDTVANELFYHGRVVYEEVMAELLAWIKNRANMDLSGAASSYRYKWNQFVGHPQSWMKEMPVDMDSFFRSPTPRVSVQAKDDNAFQPAIGVSEGMEGVVHARQVAETGSSDSSGMSPDTMQHPDPDAAAENTVLTDAQVVDNDSALTAFRDVQETRESRIDTNPLPPIDCNFVFPKGYFDVLERMVHVHTSILPSSTPNPYPILRLDPLNALLSQNFLANKLNYARFIRFNMEVQIKILATNFHYGLLLAVFRPSYMPFLKLHWGAVENERRRRVEVLRADWAPQGPYDSVFTASQLPHEVLSMTAGNSVTLQCPWTLNFQYAPTEMLLTPRFHIGLVDIYLLTPILPTDADPPSIQVFARLCDITGFGYQDPGDPCSQHDATLVYNIYSVESDSSNTHTDRIPRDGLGGLHMDQMDFTKTLGHMNDSDFIKSVQARWQLQPKQFKVQARDELSTIMSTHWSSAIPKTFAQVASFVGRGLQQLGLSKPPLDRPTNPVINVAPPIANSIGADFTYPTSYHVECLSRQPRFRHSDQTQISKLASTLQYVGYHSFSLSAKQAIVNLSPEMVVWDYEGKHGFVPHPAAYICNRFALWRSSCHYRLRFSGSSFVNARFSVTASYRNQDPEAGLVPTQYVEVKGDAVAEATLPFLHEAPWALVIDESVQWTITIKLLDYSYVSWKRDEHSPIVCTLEVGFPDLQVAQPTLHNHTVINWGYGYYFEGTHPINAEAAEEDRRKNLGKIVFNSSPPTMPLGYGRLRMTADGKLTLVPAQSKDLPGIVHDSSVHFAGTNDIPTSVYHIAKRYQCSRSTILVPLAAMQLIFTENNSNTYYVTYNGNATYYAALFRWVSGSVNVVTDAFNIAMDIPFIGHVYEQLIHDPQLYKDEKIANLMTQYHPYLKRMSEKVVAIRQPYRSNVPMVSGPHLWQYWIEQSGYQGMHGVPMQTTLTPYEGLQGLFFHYDKNDVDAASFSWSMADDLCYSLFLGTPMMCIVDEKSLSTALYGPSNL